MLYSGICISKTPHKVIGNLYFTELGEPYIQYRDTKTMIVIRYLVYWHSIRKILIPRHLNICFIIKV